MNRSAWSLVLTLALSLAPATALAQPDPPVAPPPDEPSPPADAAAVALPPVAVVADDDEHDEDDADPALDTTSLEHDLAMLGVGSAMEEDKLNIYGFATADYRNMLGDPAGAWAYVSPKESFFAVASINLYLTREIGTSWRSLAEVRYTYAPSGGRTEDGQYSDTTTEDPGNHDRPVQWGGMVLERAYLDHDVTEWLTLRAGTYLTPYGIWNVDHGTPVIIPISRPYIIGEQLFPERQTGIQAFGSRSFDEYTLAYNATLSNGRGPLTAFRDLDENKGLGGRVELTTPWLGSTRIGVSGYEGRYTTRPANEIAVDEDGNIIATEPAGTSYDEVSLGADLLLEHGPLHVQGELIYNQRRYRDGERAVAPGGGFHRDSRYVGTYLMFAWRLERWWHMMPYINIEYDKPWITPDIPDNHIFIVDAGINMRPLPSVVLKVALARVESDISYTPEPALWFSTQAAWVF